MSNFRTDRFHIIVTLPGDTIAANYAVIRINEHVMAAVRDGQALARMFYKTHGGYGGLYVQGGNATYVSFLSDIPEGDFEMEGDPDRGGARITGISADNFEDLCRDQDMDVSSEMEGFCLGEETFRIVGYEKHCDELLETDNLYKWLLLSYEYQNESETSKDGVE